MKKLASVLLLSSVAAPVLAADVANTGSAQVDETQVINCPPGKDYLGDAVFGQLQVLAKHLEGKGNLHLSISGHVDEQALPAAKRAAYGDKAGLSQARAKVAADYLHAQPGLSAAVIEVSGKGDSEPKVSCDKQLPKAKYADCLAPNRRLEVHIRYDQATAAAPVAAQEVAAVAAPVVAETAPAVAEHAAAPVAAAGLNSDKPSSNEAPVGAISLANEVRQQAGSNKAEAANAPSEFNQGFYAAADLGLANYSNTASAYDNAALPNPYAVKLAGGYRYNPYLAAEAGYAAIGDSILKTSGAVVLTETLKATVLHVAAVGTYPINDKFDAFGKLGVASTALDYTYACSTNIPASGSGSGTKTNLMFGLGGTYKITPRYSVRLQYENFGKTTLSNTYSNGKTTAADVGLSVISVGGVYSF